MLSSTLRGRNEPRVLRWMPNAKSQVKAPAAAPAKIGLSQSIAGYGPPASPYAHPAPAAVRYACQAVVRVSAVLPMKEAAPNAQSCTFWRTVKIGSAGTAHGDGGLPSRLSTRWSKRRTTLGRARPNLRPARQKLGPNPARTSTETEKGAVSAPFEVAEGRI
jgi:hypothetical protein